MNAKRTPKASNRADQPARGRADLARLRRMTEEEIEQNVPDEFANLPPDFWTGAKVVLPPSKQAVSIRVDQDVLEWFKHQGPRYQTRMNAVLRSYMTQSRRRTRPPRSRARKSA